MNEEKRAPIFAMAAASSFMGHAVKTAALLQQAEVELQCCVPPHLFQRALAEAAAARDASVYNGRSALRVTLDAYHRIRDGYMTGELS